MYEVKLYKSKLKSFYLLFGSLGFILMILLIEDFSIQLTLENTLPIFSILLFGIGIPIGLYQIIDCRPQMIISKNGIWERSSLKNELKWEQIIEIVPIQIHSQTILSIQTDDSYILSSRKNNIVTKFNNLFGFYDQNINIGNLSINEVELLRLLYQVLEADERKRQNLILNFSPNIESINKKQVLYKGLKYLSISMLLLILTLSSFIFFGLIMFFIGLSALYLKFNLDFIYNESVEKYAKRMIYLGMANAMLVLGTYKVFEYNKIDLNDKIDKIKEEIKIRLR